jgi:uncharacterized membrane protein
MRTAQTLTLIAATITTGLMAGLFFAFTSAIMPALRGADDRTFVDVMQRINVSIINPVFMTAFVGGLLVTIAAVVVHWRDEKDALPWIIAGLALYAAMFLITAAINVPLNNALDAAGDPGRIADLRAVRNQFEGRWVAWNIVRAVANVAAFGCLAYALLVFGRATPEDAVRSQPGATAQPPPFHVTSTTRDVVQVT